MDFLFDKVVSPKHCLPGTIVYLPKYTEIPVSEREKVSHMRQGMLGHPAVILNVDPACDSVTSFGDRYVSWRSKWYLPLGPTPARLLGPDEQPLEFENGEVMNMSSWVSLEPWPVNAWVLRLWNEGELQLTTSSVFTLTRAVERKYVLPNLKLFEKLSLAFQKRRAAAEKDQSTSAAVLPAIEKHALSSNLDENTWNSEGGKQALQNKTPTINDTAPRVGVVAQLEKSAVVLQPAAIDSHTPTEDQSSGTFARGVYLKIKFLNELLGFW